MALPCPMSDICVHRKDEAGQVFGKSIIQSRKHKEAAADLILTRRAVVLGGHLAN